jgi:hypothetical protein
MQESPAKRDELFYLICRLLGGEEKGWGIRLVSVREIVTRLLWHEEAKVIFHILSKRQPDLPAQQLAGELVLSLAESAARVDSKWHHLVEAAQIQGEWFLRLKPQSVASHAQPAGAHHSV